jgi:hypothetical protein
MNKQVLGALLGVAAVLPFGSATVSAATTWKSVAPMPKSRCCMAATKGLNGDVYVIGGKPVGKLSDDTMVYNPTTNKWSTLPPAPNPGEQAGPAAATGLQGKVYSVGGGFYDGVDQWQDNGGLSALSTKTNTWTIEGSMPTPRGDLAAVGAPNGFIYALGGAVDDSNDNAISSSVVEAYNPTTNSWAEVASMHQARDQFGAVIGPDGRMYAVGGEYVTDSIETDTASVEAYSFQTKTWTQVAPLPTATLINGAVLGADGRIYAVGPGFLAALNVQKNTWTTLTAPPPATLPTAFGPNDTTSRPVAFAVAAGKTDSILFVNESEAYKTSPAYLFGT